MALPAEVVDSVIAVVSAAFGYFLKWLRTKLSRKAV